MQSSLWLYAILHKEREHPQIVYGGPETHPPWMLRTIVFARNTKSISSYLYLLFRSSAKCGIAGFSNICVCVHSSFYMEYYLLTFSSFPHFEHLLRTRSYVIILASWRQIILFQVTTLFCITTKVYSHSLCLYET